MDKDAIIKRQAAYIKQLEAENATLKQRIETLEKYLQTQEKRIQELERRLGMNSQNSPMPPSSDPPGMAVAPPARRGKKRGARKGHPPHLRAWLPPEAVTQRIELKPHRCPCGGTHLEKTAETPLRHQIVDIPPIRPDVTEYLQPVYRCRDCGARVYPPLPAEIKRTYFGPGILALVGILTGVLNTSKRKALTMIQEVFGVPMSLGGLSACEARLARVLAEPHRHVHDYVQQQPTAHADETGWPRGNRDKGWLWMCGCTVAAFFMVQAHRSQQTARAVLGAFAGILITDRYNAYRFYAGLRQICWAHLKRDFKAISEAGGSLGKIGLELHDLAKHILKMRKRVRDGTLPWQTFQRRMPVLQKRTEVLLEKGARFDGKLGGKCRDILEHRDALWTFVQNINVDPTNNLAERLVRQAVLWRKGSFGTQSERGARYAERILTVCATCRLQGRSVIAYLREACHCHRIGLPVPSLIPTTVKLVRTA